MRNIEKYNECFKILKALPFDLDPDDYVNAITDLVDVWFAKIIVYDFLLWQLREIVKKQLRKDEK